MIEIIGAKGKIDNVDKFLKRVKDFSLDKNVKIQIFNADTIYGKNHLLSAYKHSIRAFKTNTNATNSLEIEIILYAAGERQIKLAIPKVGIKKGKSNIAIILFKNKNFQDKLIDELLIRLKLIRDESVLLGNINKLIRFGIKKEELDTISELEFEDLILEKVALVDILK